MTFCFKTPGISAAGVGRIIRKNAWCPCLRASYPRHALAPSRTMRKRSDITSGRGRGKRNLVLGPTFPLYVGTARNSDSTVLNLCLQYRQRWRR